MSPFEYTSALSRRRSDFRGFELGDGLALQLAEHEHTLVDVGLPELQRRLLLGQCREAGLRVGELLHVRARRAVLERDADEPPIEPGEEATSVERGDRGGRAGGRGSGPGRIRRRRRRSRRRLGAGRCGRQPDAEREQPRPEGAPREPSPPYTSHTSNIGSKR